MQRVYRPAEPADRPWLLGPALPKEPERSAVERCGTAASHTRPGRKEAKECGLGLTDEVGRRPDDDEGGEDEAADPADAADADDAGRDPESPPLAAPNPPKPGNSCCKNCGSGPPAGTPSPPSSPPAAAAAAACGLFTNSFSFSQVSSSFSSETSCKFTAVAVSHGPQSYPCGWQGRTKRQATSEPGSRRSGLSRRRPA